MNNENAQSKVLELLNKPENQLCADCKSSNPRNVSMQYGIFVCDRCAEIHKIALNEGIFSEIKSVDNDNWNQREAALLERIGNSVSNNYYESRLPSDFCPDSVNTEDITTFIKDKYENKKWASLEQDPPLDSTIPNVLTQMSTALSIGVQFILLIIANISFIFLWILKLFKFYGVVKLASFELAILTELFSSDFKFPEIGVSFYIEFWYGKIGFGFLKGLVLMLCLKMIRKSYSIEQNGNYLYYFAVLLFIYFFGFESILLIYVCGFILFLIILTLLFRLIRGKMSSCFSGFSNFSSEFVSNLNNLFDGDLSIFNQNDDRTPIYGRVEEVENENDIEYDQKNLDEKDLNSEDKIQLESFDEIKEESKE